jgi:hypothetical protein
MTPRFASLAPVFILALISLASGPISLADDNFTPIDIGSQANGKLDESFGSGWEGSDLKNLPRGQQVFAGVRFYIGSKLIQLGSKREEFQNKPEKVEGIELDQKLSKLHLLQAVQNGGIDPWRVDENTLVGEYRVNFDDHSAVIIPIVYGLDVNDWFFTESDKGPSRGVVAWTGDNDFAPKVDARIRLYKTTWKNPWPDKTITTIDFSARKSETVAAPFCVAITAEQE